MLALDIIAIKYTNPATAGPLAQTNSNIILMRKLAHKCQLLQIYEINIFCCTAICVYILCMYANTNYFSRHKIIDCATMVI